MLFEMNGCVPLIVLCLGLSFMLILFAVIDPYYYVRSLITIILAKWFKKKIGFFDTSVTYGMVLPTDSDLWLTHMNNARVIREFDFCRLDHLIRTGMLRILIRKQGGGVLSAQVCRYRRALHMFSLYKIITKPVYFDTRHIYFEHTLVTHKDNIIRNVAYVKLAFKVNIEDVVENYYPDVVKPEIPKDLKIFLEYTRASSEKLRNTKITSEDAAIKASDMDERPSASLITDNNFDTSISS